MVHGFQRGTKCSIDPKFNLLGNEDSVSLTLFLARLRFPQGASAVWRNLSAQRTPYSGVGLVGSICTRQKPGSLFITWDSNRALY